MVVDNITVHFSLICRSNNDDSFMAKMCRITNKLHGADYLLRNQEYAQLVKKFPTFYGTRRFIIVFTRARHLSLS
jgi:hypothetical protein